ncbi:MAG TPA: hypothetical protein VN611_17775 [Patescibacteria group bacterium]|nr:hypothetical protein [Patescibacteria group bacterium]
MKKSLTLFLILSLCLLMFSGIASAATINLVNQTGVEIHELNITISSQNDWGGDLLGSQVMPSGTQVGINLDPNAGTWDMQALDPEGNTISWTGLNLRGVSQIVLDASGTANLQ